MSAFDNHAPAGLEVARSRYDVPVQQGIEVVPSQHNIPYKSDDAKELYTPESPPKKRRICGLSFVAFWTLIAILAVVILGAAIGGGVGGGLAARNKNTSNAASNQPESPITTGTSSTSSHSPSTTSTSSSSSSATACPAADGTKYVPSMPGTSQPYHVNGSDLAYTVRCNTDYAAGASYGNPSVVDLQILSKVDSLDACIGACATYTNQLVQTANTSASCDAVGWISTQSQCFLKNGVTSSSYNNTANLATYPVDSAIQAGL